MSRAFFAEELDTAASWWRIYRQDGVTLGFTTHDRDLYFGGILHRAAPGMLPSAIRQSMRLEDDEAEVEGALAHDTIRAQDIAAGQFDGARMESGVVDWDTLEHAVLYTGSIDALTQDSGTFGARLRSAAKRVSATTAACSRSAIGPDAASASAANTSFITAVSQAASLGASRRLSSPRPVAPSMIQAKRPLAPKPSSLALPSRPAALTASRTVNIRRGCRRRLGHR